MCIERAARAFAVVYAADTSGFPAAALLGVLQQPDLEVQCEEQVGGWVGVG